MSLTAKFKQGNAAIRHGLVLCVVLVAAAAAAYKISNRPSLALFQMPEMVPQESVRQVGGMAGLQSRFVSRTKYIHTHAASLVELGDGRIRAFWFAGSREGAQDVDIRSAVFDPVKNLWSAEQSIINRKDTQRALLRYVKKLGNPVAHRQADGTLWLFYVTVSLGGWAGSSITAITSKDDGATWGNPRRLITTPFINISTLVKSTPFNYIDGSIGLPVYHEFIGKFGELLRIGSNGEVIDKTRLSAGKSSLQPVLLIQNQRQAVALMRYSGAGSKRVMATRTDDAGQHWSALSQIALANPDAAITGVALPNKSSDKLSGRNMVMVVNDTEHGRDVLSLVASPDSGASWKTLYQLEDQRGQSTEPTRYLQTVAELAKAADAGIVDVADYGKSAQRTKCEAQSCGYEFSYPYMIQTRNGNFHLVYTWNRSFIKHLQFSRAWLDAQLQKMSNVPLH